MNIKVRKKLSFTESEKGEKERNVKDKGWEGKNVKYADKRESKLLLVEYKRGVLHSCNTIHQTKERF